MISELIPYIIQLDEHFIKDLNIYITERGAANAFNDYLKYLDCTKIVDGLRLHQTIGVPYQLDMTRAYIIATEYLDNDNVYLDKLLTVHKANIAFEKENPPIIYKDKKQIKQKEKKEFKEKKTRVKLSKEDKTKLSLAKKAKTFSTLTFTFKTKNDGNNNII